MDGTPTKLNLRRRGYFNGRRPRVLAHRGASAHAPENTLVAFEKAVEQGADILEMDVRLTADNRVVVIHDADVRRTTDGIGKVRGRLLSELKELDAGYKFSPDGGRTFPYRGTGLEVPTLEEVLKAFPEVPMHIDIKENELRLIHGVVGLLDKYHRTKRGDVLLAGTGEHLMEEIRKAAPRGITGHSRYETWRFLWAAWLGRPELYRGRGDAIHLPFRRLMIPLVFPRVVKMAHQLGLELHTWTVNKEPKMKSLISMGVDGIFTDDPAAMRKLLDGNMK